MLLGIISHAKNQWSPMHPKENGDPWSDAVRMCPTVHGTGRHSIKVSEQKEGEQRRSQKGEREEIFSLENHVIIDFIFQKKKKQNLSYSEIYLSIFIFFR